MSFILVALAALFVSTLTLFSGFGLGTLLLPVFALFFPVETAVAATALVHGANNVMKASLLGKHADWTTVRRFGLPALLAAFGGAAVLGWVSHLPSISSYEVFGLAATVTPIKLVMGLLMLFFALFELLPRFRALRFERRWLALGGVVSGFFGGLSGHQGALRSAFLVKAGLDTPAFVGTNAVIGLMVDLARLLVYGAIFLGMDHAKLFTGEQGWLVLTGTLAAFAGVILGKRLLKMIKMSTVQTVTGILLLAIALLLGAGLI